MKIQALLNPEKQLHENWGSTDWAPIMVSMKQHISAGESLEHAALKAVQSHYHEMGYDTAEDAVDMTMQIYQARNTPGHKFAHSSDYPDSSFDADAWRDNRGPIRVDNSVSRVIRPARFR